jgi:hypothetical protein
MILLQEVTAWLHFSGQAALIRGLVLEDEEVREIGLPHLLKLARFVSFSKKKMKLSYVSAECLLFTGAKRAITPVMCRMC